MGRSANKPKEPDQKDQAGNKQKPGPEDGTNAPAITRVEVLCEGRLGPRLLKKGNVTDDPGYVALLDNPRKAHLVRPVTDPVNPTEENA